MSEEKKVNHLTVFLIKQPYKAVDQIIKMESCDAPVDVAIAGHGSGKLFVKKSPATPPKWADLFKQYLDLKSLATRGVSAAFFIEINRGCFGRGIGRGSDGYARRCRSAASDHLLISTFD